MRNAKLGRDSYFGNSLCVTMDKGAGMGLEMQASAKMICIMDDIIHVSMQMHLHVRSGCNSQPETCSSSETKKKQHGDRPSKGHYCYYNGR